MFFPNTAEKCDISFQSRSSAISTWRSHSVQACSQPHFLRGKGKRIFLWTKNKFWGSCLRYYTYRKMTAVKNGVCYIFRGKEQIWRQHLPSLNYLLPGEWKRSFDFVTASHKILMYSTLIHVYSLVQIIVITNMNSCIKTVRVTSVNVSSTSEPDVVTITSISFMTNRGSSSCWYEK